MAERKNIPHQPLPDRFVTELLPVVIAERTFSNAILQLRGSESGAKQLVWRNVKPLEVPGIALYADRNGDGDLSSGHFIGRVEGKAVNVFNLDASPAQRFIIYDFIRRKILRRIDFGDEEHEQSTLINKHIP